MRRHPATISFALVALLGLVALLVGAGTDERDYGFSLTAQVSAPLAPLEPGQIACQGPIHTTTTFAKIEAFLATAAAPGAGLDVSVRDARAGTTLATGRVRPHFASEMIVNVPLSTTIRAGRTITVCLRSTGPQRIALIGSPASDPGVVLTVAGQRTNSEAALTFLRPRPRSLLSLIPTVFDRATLFRPRWVGVWTFWLLAAGLLVAFGIGGLAIAQAVRADTRSSERTKQPAHD